MPAPRSARWRLTALLAGSVVIAAGLSACSSSGGSSGGTTSGASAAAGGSGSAAAAGTSAAVSKASEIRIGLDFPTTGADSVLGAGENLATKMLIDDANAKGGIDGVPIKVFEGDSQSDPSTAATVAQRLIDQNHVTIIIGSYASGLAQTILPVAQRNHVMLWEVSAVAPGMNPKGNKYFLRTVGDASTYAAADISFLKGYLAAKIGKPVTQLRIGVAHENGPFGSSVAAAVVKQAKAANLNVVADIAYKETTPDMTPVVLKLKKANPDVVLITPLPTSTPLFWEAAKTQNLQAKAIIGSAGFSSSAFLKKFGAKGIEGAYDVEPPSIAGMSLSGLQSDVQQVVKSFLPEFQQKAGYACSVHCGNALGGVYMLLHYVLPKAISAYGNADALSVWNAAHQVTAPFGGSPMGFGMKFTDAGENASAESVIMQWQSGQLKVVWPKDLASASPEYPSPSWSER